MRAPFTSALPHLGLAIFGLALGCGSCGGSDGFDLRVDVRTDWVPSVEFTEVEVSVEGSAASTRYAASFDDDFLRGIRVATLEDVGPGLVTVRAQIREADGRRLAERVVELDVRSASSVTLVFTRNCRGVTCPDGDPSATECSDGRCVPPTCSPENPDACGEASCTTSDDCDEAPVGCARSVCTDGECFVGSDFAACATGEYCHPELGCTDRPTGSDAGMSMPDGGMDDGGTLPSECGQPCDTGDDCETGVFDCTDGVPVCVREELVPEGTVCRESTGACDVAETCDGTSAACPIDGFEPIGTTCSVGFCDGLGTCSDTCTPGAACSTGNVCETGTIDCDSGSPVCTRSGSAPNGTSCGATDNGMWGGCSGYSSACDETGTRSREVTTYACSSGSCNASTNTETEACGRNTDGTMCQADDTGSWSGCSGFSGTCDETGTQSRTVTSYECSSGSCGSSSSSETRSCTRNTDGASCGTVTYGGWGACGYSNTCDESATRSRNVMTPTCGSGTCGIVTTTQTEPCTRDTDGTSCGATQYGGWGPCGGFADRCDETGTESRSVTDYACAAGSCQAMAGTPETRACSRNTEGVACIGTVVPCYTPRCSGGSCTQVYACTPSQICCGDPGGCQNNACP